MTYTGATGTRLSADWSSLTLQGVNPTGREIGRGAYGRVFEVDYEGTLCAAKEIHALLLQYAQGEGLQKIKGDFLAECQIWSRLRHPCIVQVLGVYFPATDQHRLPVMVMEKMQQSLRALLEKYNNIPLNVKLSILDEVCLGLRYLHTRTPPIVHRDLTPNNILLGGCLEAKITDLGVAKAMMTDNKQTMTKIPGTPDYMPPEALIKKPVYGPSLDVFSYGGVMLNVTTQLWPEPSDNIQFNPDTGRREVVSEVTRRQHYLDKMTGGAADLKPLVISCLDDNPKNRPPLTQISMTVKRVKDVVCSNKSSRDAMSPIVWWSEVSNEQQSQVTTSLTTALEEMLVNNEQLRKENDAMKEEVGQLKDQVKVTTSLTTALEEMTINNEQLRRENDVLRVHDDAMKEEVGQLKAENHQLKQQLILKESNTPGDLFSGPVKIRWEEGAPSPVERVGGTAVWLDGLVYVGGGVEDMITASYRIDTYNPTSNSWSPPINTPYSHFAMTTLNNKLIIAGGKDKTENRTNQILIMEDGQLKNYTKMTTTRSHATAAGHQGILIITGGWDYKGKILSSSELYNSTSGRWYTCDDLPQPHYWLQSVIINNTLYLLGGINQDYNSSPAVFTAPLDTLSRHQLKWNTLQDTPWNSSAPVSVHDTHLLVIGGGKKIGSRYTRTSEVYKFNHVSHSWEAIEHLLSAARSELAAVSTADNRVIVIGGRGRDHKVQCTNTVWIGSFEQ